MEQKCVAAIAHNTPPTTPEQLQRQTDGMAYS